MSINRYQISGYQTVSNNQSGPLCLWSDVAPLMKELDALRLGALETWRPLIAERDKLKAELSRYKTPMVDDVEFLPSDPENHKVVEYTHPITGRLTREVCRPGKTTYRTEGSVFNPTTKKWEVIT